MAGGQKSDRRTEDPAVKEDQFKETRQSSCRAAGPERKAQIKSFM